MPIAPIALRGSLLAALTALLIPSPLPAAEVPRALLKNALDAHFPHTKGLALSYEQRRTSEVAFVVECRARRQAVEDTYRLAPDQDDGHGKRRSALVVACIRAGLVAAADVPGLGPESIVAFNPYLDPTLVSLTLLERRHSAGTIFAVSGILRAHRTGQKWSISPFAPADSRSDPGQTLADFCDPACTEALYPSLPRSGPAHFIVADSREWRDLLTEMRAIRDRRRARLEKQESVLRAWLRPGAEYWIETTAEGPAPDPVPAKVTFQIDPATHARTMRVQRPTHPQWIRAFGLGEMQRDFGEAGESAAARYQRLPDLAPTIRLSASSEPLAEGGGQIFGEPRPTFDLTLRAGQLLLIHRESGHCYPLTRQSPATTRAAQQDQCPPVAAPPFRRPAPKQAQARR